MADGQTGRIIPLLVNVETHVKFIRNMRDDLYCRLSAWNDLLVAWRELDIGRIADVMAVLDDTYRYLASRYMMVDEWDQSTRETPATATTGRDWNDDEARKPAGPIKVLTWD